MNIEEVKKFIDDRQKSLSWYQRNKRKLRNNYLKYKFILQDWRKDLWS